MINIIDLFCGCGGLSYGFTSSEFNILLGLDNNRAALKTYKKNHVAEVLEGDLSKQSYSDIKKVVNNKNIDIIIGGPPCQGVSITGPRKFDDPRNNLFTTFLKFVREFKPYIVLMENVPGLISLYKGELKYYIEDEFTKLGYSLVSNILCAADYGVPQMRKRLFFLGILNHNKKINLPSPTHSSNTNPLFQLKDHITCESALSDLPSLDAELGTDIQDYKIPPQNDYQFMMRLGSEKLFNHVAVNHSDKIKKIISLVPDGGNYKDLPLEYKNTRNFNIAWTRFNSKKPAPTIDTGHRHHFHYKYNRVPTVRESARIQSFPDKFIFFGNKSQQNKQVGNAVPPLLAQAISEEIKKCL